MSDSKKYRPIKSPSWSYSPSIISAALAKKPLLGAVIAALILLLSFALNFMVEIDAANAYATIIPLLSWAWFAIAAYYVGYWLRAENSQSCCAINCDR